MLRADENAEAEALPGAIDAFLSGFGLSRKAALERRAALFAEIRRLLDAPKDTHIAVTGGGTVADAEVLIALQPRHVVTTSIEHPAVLLTLSILEEREALEHTRVSVGKSGRVSPDGILAALRDTTDLVSVMAASNETGVLQPVAELGAELRRRGILLHSDAVQCGARRSKLWSTLNADVVVLSSHKLGAIPGTGLVLSRSPLPHTFLTSSDGPVSELRIPELEAIVFSLHQVSEERNRAVAECRDRLERRLDAIGGVSIVGRDEPRLPNTSCVIFDGCDGDGIMMSLDLQGIAVSVGSACASGSIEPSPALLAMGFDPEEAKRAVRFSLPVGVVPEQVDVIADRVGDVVMTMRRTAT